MTDEERELGSRAVTTFPELFPELPRRHKVNIDNGKCYFCDKQAMISGFLTAEHWEQPKGECVDRPTVIDWNVAMMLVREVDGQGVIDRLHVTYCNQATELSFKVWLITGATPADYIKAAIETEDSKQ